MLATLTKAFGVRTENILLQSAFVVLVLLIISPSALLVWWIYQDTDWSAGVLPTLRNILAAVLWRPATFYDVLLMGLIVGLVSRPRRR